MHTLGHFWNLNNTVNSWLTGSPLANKLNEFGGINPVAVPYSNITKDLFEIQAGYTGILLVLVFHLMVTTAAIPIRRSFYELFWYVHHLFILIYPLMYFHGAGSLIKQQTNTEEHDPAFCGLDENLDTWGDAGGLCPEPEYIGKFLYLHYSVAHSVTVHIYASRFHFFLIFIIDFCRSILCNHCLHLMMKIWIK